MVIESAAVDGHRTGDRSRPRGPRAGPSLCQHADCRAVRTSWTPSSQARNAWCLSHGLAARLRTSATRLLRAFRETLRELLFANNGEGDPRAPGKRLRPFLASARLRPRRQPASRGLELRPEGRRGRSPSLLAIVYESHLPERGRVCAPAGRARCRFAYYDRTKNASRAWCSMATCGNQAKAHAPPRSVNARPARVRRALRRRRVLRERRGARRSDACAASPSRSPAAAGAPSC